MVRPNAGFKGDDLVTAVGLWQINKVNWKALGGKEELYKAAGNAAGAFRTYKDSGKTFNAWVVFNKGSYKTHLAAAKAAVQAITGKP